MRERDVEKILAEEVKRDWAAGPISGLARGTQGCLTGL